MPEGVGWLIYVNANQYMRGCRYAATVLGVLRSTGEHLQRLGLSGLSEFILHICRASSGAGDDRCQPTAAALVTALADAFPAFRDEEPMPGAGVEDGAPIIAFHRKAQFLAAQLHYAFSQTVRACVHASTIFLREHASAGTSAHAFVHTTSICARICKTACLYVHFLCLVWCMRFVRRVVDVIH